VGGLVISGLMDDNGKEEIVVGKRQAISIRYVVGKKIPVGLSGVRVTEGLSGLTQVRDAPALIGTSDSPPTISAPTIC